jgi:hypothetical protein
MANLRRLLRQAGCLLGLALATATRPGPGASDLGVKVLDEGQVWVLRGGAPLFKVASRSLGFRDGGRWLTPGQGLSLEGVEDGLHGEDALGPYRLTEVTWRAKESRKRFQTNARVYLHTHAVALQQVFVDGAARASTGDEDQVKFAKGVWLFTIALAFDTRLCLYNRA